MRHRPDLATQRAITLDDLGEAGRQLLDRPPRVLLHDIARKRLAHLPVGGRRRERRPDGVAVDLYADLDIGERELLDRKVALVQELRLEQQPRVHVGPQLVAVAHSVLGLEKHRLCFDARDPRHLALAEEVVHGECIDLLRQQRRKGVAIGARLDPDDLGVVAADLLVVADDFAGRTVEVDELLVLALLVDHVHKARGFGPCPVLVEQRSGISLLPRGACRALQPIGGFLRRRGAREQDRDERKTCATA